MKMQNDNTNYNLFFGDNAGEEKSPSSKHINDDKVAEQEEKEQRKQQQQQQQQQQQLDTSIQNDDRENASRQEEGKSSVKLSVPIINKHDADNYCKTVASTTTAMKGGRRLLPPSSVPPPAGGPEDESILLMQKVQTSLRIKTLKRHGSEGDLSPLVGPPCRKRQRTTSTSSTNPTTPNSTGSDENNRNTDL